MKKLLVACLLLSYVVISWSQQGQKKVISAGETGDNQILPPRPIDPQIIQDQDDMTWDDYHPIPGKNWADPSLIPERKFKMALVAVDFPDQPFVITLPKKSDLFGNPQTDPVKREDVPKFYSDFWLRPSAVNHGQTINGYWMEQSRGMFGITALDPYGPYRMPKNHWEYGLNEYGQNNSTPDGTRAGSRMERDVDALWSAAAGDIKKQYDAILRIYAGYDETGVWQEFGEMKFLTKEDIPAEWGNPDTSKPRWVPTRYVPWTSWKAGQMQWGLSSIRQGENSGTITHELGHYAFDIGDNNNNPYIQPYRRVGSGPWDMMDRGSFNGPGGPHMRWVVPATMGASMPAGLMLRNRMVNGFIPENKVLTISREGLAKSGPVVATITARAVEPLKGTYAGIIVRLDGAEPHDRTPVDDPAVNPLSPGIPNFDFYSLEVVQRIGYDAFCPDNGVLLAKNKDKESRNGGPNGFNCFNWVIDAHPEDINMVDYVKPDGTPVMRTIADYRQLNDALFHAGNNSGSEYEWEDVPNKLHFYIIDLQKNNDGILSYRIGIRSLDGSVPQKRGVAVMPPSSYKMKNQAEYCTFTISNTGEMVESDPSLHNKDISANLNYDIFRLHITVKGTGWNGQLLNSLVSMKPGESEKIPVYISHNTKCSGSARITLTAKSENDPEKVLSSAFTVRAARNKR
jgi:M6 family metalloprotease-like protein